MCFSESWSRLWIHRDIISDISLYKINQITPEQFLLSITVTLLMTNNSNSLRKNGLSDVFKM